MAVKVRKRRVRILIPVECCLLQLRLPPHSQVLHQHQAHLWQQTAATGQTTLIVIYSYYIILHVCIAKAIAIAEHCIEITKYVHAVFYNLWLKTLR